MEWQAVMHDAARTVCDPVMGDDGRLYVPDGAAATYRDALVPLASVLTPNQFEAEQLTGMPLRSARDALAACRALHARGPHTVARARPRTVPCPALRGCAPVPSPGVTANPHPPCGFHSHGPRALQVITSFRPPGPGDGHLSVIASTTLPQERGSWPALQLRLPRVDAYFTGTGAPRWRLSPSCLCSDGAPAGAPCRGNAGSKPGSSHQDAPICAPLCSSHGGRLASLQVRRRRDIPRHGAAVKNMW